MADHDIGHSVPPPLERRLATILQADVANYSRVMAENEEQTLLTFRGHQEVFESLVSTHRGRIFNTAGDAILAEFVSAVEAVAAPPTSRPRCARVTRICRPRSKCSFASASTNDRRSEAIADPDGSYSGPVCFGATDRVPARCFRGEATVSLGTIKDQWTGREEKVVMKVAGEVAASGAVVIELHSENPEGARLATVDLVGSLQNGRLEATGTFRNGRSASLNWHRNERP